MGWGPAEAHLWGYSPYLNVFCVSAAGSIQDTGPAQMFLVGANKASDATKNEHTERHLRPFFLDPPPTCPYRPLISYKIGQMPTVTRGG